MPELQSPSTPLSSVIEPSSSVVSRQTSVVDSPSLVVLWRLTEACDLDCSFCEYRRSLRRPRRTVNAADVVTFGRVLGDYSRETGRPVLLGWLGGEPLLWPAIWEVSRTVHHEFGLHLSLTTNGTRLTPALCRRLAADFAEVTLSVDGDASFHEQVRGLAGLYPRLRAAAETLSELKSASGHGPLLRANTVLMRSNIFTLENLGSALASWGIQELTFNALGGIPGDPFYDRERLLPEHIAWLRTALPSLRARLGEQGLTMRGSDHYLDRFAHTAAGYSLPVADCFPGRSFIFVDDVGRAAPCSFTSTAYGVPVASLQSPADLHSLPARFAQHRRAARSPACADCQSTQVFGKFDA